MKEMSQNKTLEGFEDEPDKTDIVLDEDVPEVVYEDVPDEDELPAGWEDMLYDAWKERQLEKELETKKQSTLTHKMTDDHKKDDNLKKRPSHGSGKPVFPE